MHKQLTREQSERLHLMIQIPNNPGTDCWVWLGPFDRKGYARFNYYSPTEYKKPLSIWVVPLLYEIEVKPIEEGQQFHRCLLDSKCVSPFHNKLKVTRRSKNEAVRSN